ncbi:alpha/beta hydrolase [Novosphingobium sp. 9]|uniref:alpha/beta hydrolase n=1 Tax=Novosphingobium sp. 9 TaxID=2025349 RepID=UPI0021B6E1FE|nr:alpha/beta hydrolase [Novosphingobium sp. 9]
MSCQLDPEIAAFVDRLQADWARFPPLEEMSLDDARAAAEIVRAPLRQGGPEMAETREIRLDLAPGPLRIRLYRPAGIADGNAPVLVYLHGGGFVYFSIDTHDRLMREYAQSAGCAVLGVDYPLAPEHRYPVALDRLEALIDWLGDHASDLGLAPARIALGGDSAGANLALAALLRLRARGQAQRIRALVANYPAFGPEVSDAAEAAFGGPGAILNRQEMAYYFRQYTGTGATPADPGACPALETELAGLPPILLIAAECDVLCEQAETMAARMEAAGTPATLRIYPGTTHSFLEAMASAAVARRAIADTAIWLKARWA